MTSRWEHLRHDDGEHVRDRVTGWALVVQGATTSGLGGRGQWEVSVYSDDERFAGPLSRAKRKQFTGGADYDHYVGSGYYDHRPRRAELAELIDDLEARPGR